MAYWLLKSEPSKYSWQQMVADRRTHWDGVRNFQAANNLRAMKQGDRAFFYHSNEGKEIVGVVEIVRPFYPDPADPGGKFGMVDVAAVDAGEAAGLAGRDEAGSRTRRHGAAAPVAPVGLSGQRCGMASYLPDGGDCGLTGTSAGATYCRNDGQNLAVLWFSWPRYQIPAWK